MIFCLGLRCLSAPQGGTESILDNIDPNEVDLDDANIQNVDITSVASGDSCSSSTEVFDKVVNVLGDMSEVTELLLVSKNKKTDSILELQAQKNVAKLQSQLGCADSIPSFSVCPSVGPSIRPSTVCLPSVQPTRKF